MNDRFEKLRKKASEAIGKAKAHKRSVAEGAGEIAAGNLYLFAVDMELALRFAVVMSHPDDEELYFLVPTDDFSLVGSTDIAVEDHPLGPMTLRCNHGTWMPGEELAACRLVGRLDERWTDAAAQMLSDMVTGELDPTQEELETEELAEYDEWAAMVENAVAGLDAWKRRKAVVLDFTKFRTSGESSSRPDADPVRLAAASSGIEGQLQKLEGASGSQKWEVTQWEGDGTLSLQYDGEQLSFVYEAEAEEAPKIQASLDGGRLRSLGWRSFPGGGLWRSEGVDIEDVVSLSVLSDDAGWIEIRLHD